MTFKAFCIDYGVTIKSTLVGENPNNREWKEANHFKVVLQRRVWGGKRAQLTTYFSQGYGINGEPTAENVLQCLVSDSQGFANARSFEEWASEYGYNEDSRKAERTYCVVQAQAAKLAQFAGDEYAMLLACEEA